MSTNNAPKHSKSSDIFSCQL